MEYGRSYTYVFDNPNWGRNLLLGSVTFLIPVVGPIVWWGYLCEVIESLVRDAEAPWPDYTFDRFVEYLKRGIWPFIAAMIVGIATVPVMWIGQVLNVAGIALVEKSAALTVALVGLGMLIMFVGQAAVNLAMIPMVLKAGLTGSLDSVFSWSFIKEFIRNTLWQMVAVYFFIAITGMLVGSVGLLLCCVGILPAMVLVSYAQFHLYYQLYLRHLRCGGEPIELPPQAARPKT